MNLQALMQAAPARANELFAKLLETSDGAVKTRDKLFTDLKAELELHISLEEQHLFPVLRRNAETKHLVVDAIRDNKELRTKLAEVEKLPKNHETFPVKLRELQKTFRQHARDDKRELLPAVRRALSEVQVQGVAQKMQAGLVEAQQIRHDELEERRIKARQEREEAARLQETERATKAEAERIRRGAAEKKQVAQDADRVKNVEAARVRQQEAKQQEREQAERQAAQQQEAERLKQAEAERFRREQDEQKRQAAQQEAERAKQAEAERVRQEQAEQKQQAAQQEAERAKQVETERVRQEQAAQKQQAAQQQEAERAKQAEAARISNQAARQNLVQLQQARAELLAAQQAAVERTKEAALRRTDEAAEAAARATTAGTANVIRIAENAALGARRVVGEFRGAASAYADVVKTIMPDGRAVASLPAKSVRAANEARFMWAEWVSQTARASQDALWQVVDQQQRFAHAMAQGWIEHNVRVMQLTLEMADHTVRQATSRSNVASRPHRSVP